MILSILNILKLAGINAKLDVGWNVMDDPISLRWNEFSNEWEISDGLKAIFQSKSEAEACAMLVDKLGYPMTCDFPTLKEVVGTTAHYDKCGQIATERQGIRHVCKSHSQLWE